MACEVNSGDELAATELIFGGVLSQLTPEEAVAVLAALVFQVAPTTSLALSASQLQATDNALALLLVTLMRSFCAKHGDNAPAQPS